MTLAIVRAIGLATVQDLGRRGHMHEAVPPGGALVPELLVAANRTMHNPDATPAIEVLGQLVVRAGSGMLVAIDDGPVRELVAGEELTVASGGRRCAYLAMAGGIDAPLVLDGRGTLLCAELGRPLRAGDVLRTVDATPRAGDVLRTPDVSARASDVLRTPDASRRAGDVLRAVASSPRASDVLLDHDRGTHAAERFIDGDRITIIAGPDRDAFAADAVEHLVAAPYRVLPTSDRVGTRLAGAALPRAAVYRERSRPMVIGALEVPGDGQPIVLGPEHPTTGGYPIIAVIATTELGRFFAIPLGGSVRFVLRR